MKQVVLRVLLLAGLHQAALFSMESQAIRSRLNAIKSLNTVAHGGWHATVVIAGARAGGLAGSSLSSMVCPEADDRCCAYAGACCGVVAAHLVMGWAQRHEGNFHRSKEE